MKVKHHIPSKINRPGLQGTDALYPAAPKNTSALHGAAVGLKRSFGAVQTRLGHWLNGLPATIRPTPAAVVSAPLIHRLEPRQLFDGSIVAAAVEAADILPGPETVPENTIQAVPPVPGNNVAVIDTGLNGYERLETTARAAGMEVILISARDNGFETLARHLEGRQDVDSIHILSHGGPARVFLGADTLSGKTLSQHSPALDTIARSLSPDGDLLLYGCRIGDSREGLHFVEELAGLTQADIAASDDPTGGAEKGGDWDLEISTGDIESSIPFTQKALKDFSDILSYSGTINFSNIDYIGGPYYGAANANMDARIKVGSYIMIADGTSVRTRATGTLFSGIYNGVHETQLTLKFSNGEIFDVQSLYFYHRSYDPVYGQYRDFTISSDQGHSYTIANLDNVTGQTPTLNFNNIRELRFTVAEPTGFEMLLDNLVVNNVRLPNTAPTLATPPADITIVENTTSDVDLSEVTLADVDGDPLTLTLMAGSGVFAAPADGANTGSGVTETLVNATTITLTGSAADINTYLDTPSHIQYQGPQDTSGNNSGTITLSVNDGSTGLASDPVINIHITPDNSNTMPTHMPIFLEEEAPAAPPALPPESVMPEMEVSGFPKESPPPMMMSEGTTEEGQESSGPAPMSQGADTRQTRVLVDAKGEITYDRTTDRPPSSDIIQVSGVEIDPLTQAMILVLQARDPGVLVNMKVSLSDGSPLPEWLFFSPESGTFRGIPPVGTDAIILQIIYTSPNGPSQTLEVKIQFDLPPDQEQGTQQSSRPGGPPAHLFNLPPLNHGQEAAPALS